MGVLRTTGNECPNHSVKSSRLRHYPKEMAKFKYDPGLVDYVNNPGSLLAMNGLQASKEVGYWARDAHSGKRPSSS